MYNGIDYGAVYDFNYYIAHNGDVAAAFGNDEEAVIRHFVEYGMAEGRQAKESFNVQTYKNRYSDVRAVYGNSWKAYYLHYINYGQAEGRSGAGQAKMVGATVYGGVDYSAVYDYDYYIAQSTDVAAAVGNDDEKVLKHFIEYGMKEGRQAKQEFNVQNYSNRYGDLRVAYGNDRKAYYTHYINYGKAEGRDGK